MQPYPQCHTILECKANPRCTPRPLQRGSEIRFNFYIPYRSRCARNDARVLLATQTLSLKIYLFQTVCNFLHRFVPYLLKYSPVKVLTGTYNFRFWNNFY